MAWSLSVKTVGGDRVSQPSNHAPSTPVTDTKQSNTDPPTKPPPAKPPLPSHFTVDVDPDETISSLNDKIEIATGLNAAQQRLIYRGRILSGGSAPSRSDSDPPPIQTNDILLRDVEGLCDGQTIHLVPRPAPATPPPTAAPTTETPATTSPNAENLTGSSTASLLATLLGLGVSGAFSTGADDDPDEDATRQPSFSRSALVANRRRRDREARIAAARGMSQRRSPGWPGAFGPRGGSELGSLEPVRQGLMTLNTMLDHLKNFEEVAREEGEEEKMEMEMHVTDLNRCWYRGQWLDCRDTVNQWLEATVVDIVRPQDVLSPAELSSCEAPDEVPNGCPSRRQKRKRQMEPSTDPIVGANDLEGRKRLLQEASEDNLNGSEEEREFKLRDNNKDVQLLLIHYNGWPHRWDEWIRSDSERIRPFRTKTRHSPSAPFASPTPQSVFQAAPATFITNNDEGDREALLPELRGILSTVTKILSHLESDDIDDNDDDSQKPPAIDSSTACATAAAATTTSHLPWHQNDTIANSDAASPMSRRVFDGSERAQLMALAPLLDRLGRTLTDAAPHVAAMASSIPPPPVKEKVIAEDDAETKEPNANDVAETPSSSRGVDLSLPGLVEPNTSAAVSASSPLLSSATNLDNTSPDEDNPVEQTDTSEYDDYAYGMVNVSRTEVPSRRDARRHQQENNPNSSTSSLLATYLTAAGLGGGTPGANPEDTSGLSVPTLARLLRAGGNGEGGGGGGIDIHIHAIVTPAPGLAMMGGGGGVGLGLMTLPTPATEQARGLATDGSDGVAEVNPAMSTLPSLPRDDEDELGLFSELYSETPVAVPVGDGNVVREGDVVSAMEEPRLEISPETIGANAIPTLFTPHVTTQPLAIDSETNNSNHPHEEQDIIQNDISTALRTPPRDAIPIEQRSISSISSSGSRRVSAIGRLLRRALGRRTSSSSGLERESSYSPERR